MKDLNMIRLKLRVVKVLFTTVAYSKEFFFPINVKAECSFY